MVPPEAAKILHLPLDHTHATGRYAHGQFLVDSGTVHPTGHTAQPHWCIVLHLFDDDGRHVKSHTWSGPANVGGVPKDPTMYRLASRQLHQLLDVLPDRQW